MFVKSDIRKVTAALEKRFARQAYMRIGQAGLLHLARLQGGDLPPDEAFAKQDALTRKILDDGAFVLGALKLDAGGDAVADQARDMERDAEWVARLKATADRLLRLRARIEERAAALAVQLEYAEAMERMGIDPQAFKQARLARMVFGQVPGEISGMPVDSPFMMAVTGSYVYGAALPKDAPRMLDFFRRHGFVDQSADVAGRPLSALRKRNEVLRRRLDVLERYAAGLGKEKGPELLTLHHAYRGYDEVQKAMHGSLYSQNVVFITGWMDIKDKPRLAEILSRLCGNRFALICERDPTAPVRLRNMRLFKPFELLVKTMGMPAQSEMDPTPLAALTFVLVFGLMFGDLGQGLALAAAGVVLKWIARKKANENLVQAGGILIACGLWAAFCGILYGSLFSSEHLIGALWMRPSESIMKLFSVTILLGAAVIIVGISLNIINALVNADYRDAFLEKKGLAILILYVASVYLAARYLTNGQPAALGEVILLLVLPLAVFSFRGVIAAVFFHEPWPRDPAEYITETVMEIVEITLGLFANTVSFIRVGAFALSHAGLSIVTYTLAGMADPALASAGAIAIVVFGNLFIIGFEGLICAIQSMRLEYYEFFSKFYKGDGVAFAPFVLKAKIAEV